MNQWEDISSYSKSEIERPIKSLRLKVGYFYIILHRHVHYEKDDWLVNFSNVLNDRLLKNKDLELAKDEAIRLVKQIIDAANKDLN